MASSLCLSPIPHLNYRHQHASRYPPLRKSSDFRRHGRKPSSPASDGGTQSENAVLRLAWYGSELLGIAASFFRPAPPPAPVQELAGDGDGLGSMTRAQVVEAIKEDFQRSYFVTGNLTLNAYEEDCEFADPAGSFRGLQRFKRNCSNFGLLLESSNMKLKEWEDFELLGTPSTTLMLNQEECAGMWNIGMFQRWHFLSKYSGQAAGYGKNSEELQPSSAC